MKGQRHEKNNVFYIIVIFCHVLLRIADQFGVRHYASVLVISSTHCAISRIPSERFCSLHAKAFRYRSHDINLECVLTVAKRKVVSVRWHYGCRLIHCLPKCQNLWLLQFFLFRFASMY